MKSAVKMDKTLKPYACFAGDLSEGSVLVFARTAREARRIAYPTISDWTDCGFLCVRARLIVVNQEYIQTLKQKDMPHVVENPPACPVCEYWGNPPLPDRPGCSYCGGIEPSPEPDSSSRPGSASSGPGL